MAANAKESGIGPNPETVRHGENVEFFRYVVERPTPIRGLVAMEATVDVRMKFARSVRDVWSVVKDSNVWQKSYGYKWSGVVGEEENNMVYLTNARDNKFGTQVPYIIRRVVPENLIYLESLPQLFPDNRGFWTGHNVFSMWDEGGGKSRMTCFMEHTFFSQEMSVEELKVITTELMLEQGTGFWKQYFIPDLYELIEGKRPA